MPHEDFLYDSRQEDLVNGTQTTDAVHSFPLFDEGKGGWIISASIVVGQAGTGAGGAGPVLAGAWILQRGNVPDNLPLKPSEYIRSGNLGALVTDTWHWEGRIGYMTGSSIRILVRNDSGSTILWAAYWGVELAPPGGIRP